MKPARFVYHRPQRLEEALRLLEGYGAEAKIIAGGQSLVPMMNMRLARPEHLIDINHLDEIKGIELVGEHVKVGALTRQYEVEQSLVLKRTCPIIPYAIGKIGHYAIRQRGTVGGSLAHADPAAELPVLAVLLGAKMHVRSSEGPRIVDAKDFFTTIYTTTLQPHEILTAVDFPILLPGEGWAFQEFSRRAGDFAIVSVAVTMVLDQNHRVKHMRVALGGVDTVPYDAGDLLKDVVGEFPTAKWMDAIGSKLAMQTEPGSDIHATTDDRRDLLRVLVPKALSEALLRAEKGSEPNE